MRHECAQPWRNVHKRVYTSRGRVCTLIFMKSLLLVHCYHICLSLKFHKDRSFCCSDIFQIIQSIFHIFCVFWQYTFKLLKKGWKIKDYGFFQNFTSKCLNISGKNPILPKYSKVNLKRVTVIVKVSIFKRKLRQKLIQIIWYLAQYVFRETIEKQRPLDMQNFTLWVRSVHKLLALEEIIPQL